MEEIFLGFDHENGDIFKNNTQQQSQEKMT